MTSPRAVLFGTIPALAMKQLEDKYRFNGLSERIISEHPTAMAGLYESHERLCKLLNLDGATVIDVHIDVHIDNLEISNHGTSMNLKLIISNWRNLGPIDMRVTPSDWRICIDANNKRTSETDKWSNEYDRTI
jgi:hypothetical protein